MQQPRRLDCSHRHKVHSHARRTALGLLPVLLVGSLLAACQSRPQTQVLGRNMLACRDAGVVAEIHRGGPRFQRLADDAMASGACRLFRQGQQVSGLETRGALLGFVEPASGRSYWAAR